MHTEMELLLHYTWQHRLFPSDILRAESGRRIDVIDPGLHNLHDGPDFFNAKIKIGDTLWVGNVEIHDRSSDWYRHGHDSDERYNNTILHVATIIDREVRTQKGDVVEQVQLSVPTDVLRNYTALLNEEHYPPCYRVIPKLPALTQHAWLSALTVERLEAKTERILKYLEQTEGDWERTFFVALARNFGFSTNAEAFEEWALSFPLSAVGKHRDDRFQVEAIFFGQAGFLADEFVAAEQRDDYFKKLQKEYRFLAHKFSLKPMDWHRWRFMRVRPPAFPTVRLSQLAELYWEQRVDFSQLIGTADFDALRALLRVGPTPYWETHFAFGREAAGEAEKKARQLSAQSLDLLAHQHDCAAALRLRPRAHGRASLRTRLQHFGARETRIELYHARLEGGGHRSRNGRRLASALATQTTILRPQRLPALSLRRRISAANLENFFVKNKWNRFLNSK